jgi:hypothetical protein
MPGFFSIGLMGIITGSIIIIADIFQGRTRIYINQIALIAFLQIKIIALLKITNDLGSAKEKRAFRRPACIAFYGLKLGFNHFR